MHSTALCLLKLVFDSHFLVPFEAVEHLQLVHPLLKLLLLIPCLQLVVCLELFEGKFVDFILEALHLVLGRPLPAVEPYLSSDEQQEFGFYDLLGGVLLGRVGGRLSLLGIQGLLGDGIRHFLHELVGYDR